MQRHYRLAMTMTITRSFYLYCRESGVPACHDSHLMLPRSVMTQVPRPAMTHMASPPQCGPDMKIALNSSLWEPLVNESSFYLLALSLTFILSLYSFFVIIFLYIPSVIPIQFTVFHHSHWRSFKSIRKQLLKRV